jgi:hypothetical protein
LSTPSATTGPSGASAGATTAANAESQPRSRSLNAALAYDGMGQARGGEGSHAGVPLAVRAWHAGSASTQSGMPKLVISALMCGPGRSVTASPAAPAAARNAGRSRWPVQSNRPGAVSWTRHGT